VPLIPAEDQARSYRSRFMTLSHAATKSCTNFSRPSSLVDLREGAQLRVRAEDEVDAAGGSPDLARREVAALEGLRALGRRRPLAPMSSRFTKKSLVSDSGLQVPTQSVIGIAKTSAGPGVR
jgi:hypothetical protein